MEKLILVTGGARSGKSSFAQQLAEGMAQDVAYIATAVVTDEEMRERVVQHQAARPAHWATYEWPRNAAEKLKGTNHQLYLFDCIGVYLTNLLMEANVDWDNDAIISTEDQHVLEEEAAAEMRKLVDSMRFCDGSFILVTNEVGWGVVPQTAMGRVFRDIAGRTNQILAASADEVYLTTCGLPMKLKG